MDTILQLGWMKPHFTNYTTYKYESHFPSGLAKRSPQTCCFPRKLFQPQKFEDQKHQGLVEFTGSRAVSCRAVLKVYMELVRVGVDAGDPAKGLGSVELPPDVANHLVLRCVTCGEGLGWTWNPRDTEDPRLRSQAVRNPKKKEKHSGVLKESKQNSGLLPKG